MHPPIHGPQVAGTLLTHINRGEGPLPLPKPHSQLTFIWIWTTPPSTFALPNRRSLESILFHHPHARVTVYTNTLPLDFFAEYVRTLGYHGLSVRRYDEQELVWPYLNISNGSAAAESPFYYSHVTDVLRVALLHRDGGVYLDADVVLMNSIDLLRNSE